jgi:hypothetical protein
VCRLHPNDTEKSLPIVVHNSMALGQVQRVLAGIETATLQRALVDQPGAGEDARPVDANECFSLVYRF